MRDHLREIIDALGFDRTAMIAHSMGASIAVHLARVEPNRIAGLVLAAPVGFGGVKGMKLLQFITPKSALWLLERLATRLLIRAMLSVVYGSIRRASNQDIDEFYFPTRVPGFIGSLRYLLHEFDWSRAFPRLEMPVMTIVGSEDVLSPSIDADRYSGNPTVVIRGAGHVLFDEAPEIVNPAIEGFLASRVYISSQNE
jgi:pimeloyl-ACP methyl ester carboxylesterase